MNVESQPVPLAFGYHPYFPRSGARLTFHAQGVWRVGDDGLPCELVNPSPAHSTFHAVAAVENAEIDHCFTGWNGVAIIAWPERPQALGITASRELSNAVVYIRRELDAFCFEPVPHINDALNRRDAESAMPRDRAGREFRGQHPLSRGRQWRSNANGSAARPSRGAPA